MAINLPSGFNILNIDPIDSRFVVADQSELLGFSAANVYEGLLVYQTDNNTLFVLTDIANYDSIIGWEAVNNLASDIFTLTGSFYSTTNNIQITGSLSVGSGSFKAFEVNSDGFVVLGDMNVVNKDLNNAPEGTIAYSGSSFYLIT